MFQIIAYFYAVNYAVNMKQPKIRYYLEPNRKSESTKRFEKELIMAEVSYAYNTTDGSGNARIKPFRLSLQGTIYPKNFGSVESNYTFNEIILKKFTNSDATIKHLMFRFEKALNELVSKYINENIIPTPLEFKTELKIKLNRIKKVIQKEQSILEYLSEKIDHFKTDSSMNKTNSKRPSTIKKFITVKHLIENYQIATGKKIRFGELSTELYWDIWNISDDILKDNIEIMNENQPKKQKKQSHGYLRSSLSKYQNVFIDILKQAQIEGKVIMLNCLDKSLIIKSSEAKKNFYLKESEIQLVLDAILNSDENLQLTKEYLIIACLTGMRYESMKDTSGAQIEECIEEGYNFKYIKSLQNKTSTEVLIPLFRPVMDIIFEKKRFPKFKSNVTTNKLLKKLFTSLNLKRLVEIKLETYRSGDIHSFHPMNEVISTHDCRGTFYSNLYRLNVSNVVIDKITHPDKTPKNKMAKLYNKTEKIVDAQKFVDAVQSLKSEIYIL